MNNKFNFGQSKAAFDFGNVAARPPPSSYGNAGASRAGRPIGTAIKGAEVRPVSSRQGAGFNSNLVNQANQILNPKDKYDVNKRVDTNP